MLTKLRLDSQETARLLAAPGEPVRCDGGGERFTARIAIPDYRRHIASHYDSLLGFAGLHGLCEKAHVPFRFTHFGLVVRFDAPARLQISGTGQRLDSEVKQLIELFGPIFIENAALHSYGEGREQRNIFPNLRFHFDRGGNQPEHYSLFTRNPSDPDQSMPRKSSTVFCANIVAYLQRMKEEGWEGPRERTIRTPYDVFLEEDIAPLAGRILIEHRWSAPPDTGEICVFDNAPILHASYHRSWPEKGYPIGVRYLM